jgi:hypothetical protein
MSHFHTGMPRIAIRWQTTCIGSTLEFHGPHQIAGEVSTHYPGFHTNYGHHYESIIHTHTHTYILQVSMVTMSMRVPCLPGSPGTRKLVNAESVTTRNFTDNGIYMKKGEKQKKTKAS